MITLFKLFENIDVDEISPGDYVKVQLRNNRNTEKRQIKVDYIYNNYFKVYTIDDEYCSIILDDDIDKLEKIFSNYDIDYDITDDLYFFTFSIKFIISYGKTIHELERRLTQNKFNL
jgi:hypothetical protein